MAVNVQTSRVTHLLTGTGQTLTVPFYFLAASHLKVVRVRAGVSTVLAMVSHYSVAGAGSETGGSVVLTTAAAAAGDTITILRSIPATQETDYLYADRFPAESHERALDKLTMIVQQQNDKLDRSLRVDEVAEGSLTALSGDPAARAGKLLGFDATGNPIPYAAGGVIARSGVTNEYATVAAMQTDTGIASTGTGQTVLLKGYYAAGDFGQPISLIIEAAAGGVNSFAVQGGRYANLYSRQVDVRWFGAKASDSATATQTANVLAFQAALNAMVGGGTVRFKGTYYINGTIKPGEVNFHGESPADSIIYSTHEGVAVQVESDTVWGTPSLKNFRLVGPEPLEPSTIKAAYLAGNDEDWVTHRPFSTGIAFVSPWTDGATQPVGTSVATLERFKILTCQTDYFYTGCAAGDYLYRFGTSYIIDRKSTGSPGGEVTMLNLTTDANNTVAAVSGSFAFNKCDAENVAVGYYYDGIYIEGAAIATLAMKSVQVMFCSRSPLVVWHRGHIGRFVNILHIENCRLRNNVLGPIFCGNVKFPVEKHEYAAGKYGFRYSDPVPTPNTAGQAANFGNITLIRCWIEKNDDRVLTVTADRTDATEQGGHPNRPALGVIISGVKNMSVRDCWLETHYRNISIGNGSESIKIENNTFASLLSRNLAGPSPFTASAGNGSTDDAAAYLYIYNQCRGISATDNYGLTNPNFWAETGPVFGPNHGAGVIIDEATQAVDQFHSERNTHRLAVINAYRSRSFDMSNDWIIRPEPANTDEQVPVVINKGLYFGGPQAGTRLGFVPTTDLLGTSDFTLFATLQSPASTITGAAGVLAISSSTANSFQTGSLALRWEGDDLRLRFISPTLTTADQYNMTLDDLRTEIVGEYFNIAIVRDVSENLFRFYVNGVPYAFRVTVAGAGNTPDAEVLGANLFIGTSGTNENLDGGYIADLRVFRKALTQDEIIAAISTDAAIGDEDVYYKFNQNKGTTIIDYSGNARDATVTVGAVIVWPFETRIYLDSDSKTAQLETYSNVAATKLIADGIISADAILVGAYAKVAGAGTPTVDVGETSAGTEIVNGQLLAPGWNILTLVTPFNTTGDLYVTSDTTDEIEWVFHFKNYS